MIMVSECDHNIVTLWTRTWIVVVCHEHLAVFVVAVVLPTTVVGAVPGSSAEGPGLLLSATNTLLFLLLLLYFQQLLSVLFQAPQLKALDCCCLPRTPCCFCCCCCTSNNCCRCCSRLLSCSCRAFRLARLAAASSINCLGAGVEPGTAPTTVVVL